MVMPEIPDSVVVACPRCLTANRVPRARLGEEPKCGKCGAAVLDAQPVTLDETTFDSYLGRTELPVVVDFWAPWCGPCRAMAPAFERVAGELRTHVRFAKVNTEEAQGLGARFAIRAIPTMIVFRGSRELERVSGALDARSIVQLASRHAA